MNKPLQPPVPDDDVGPLDEYGQQVWSPEDEAASARMWADAEFLAGLEKARAQFERGEWYTNEEVKVHFAERRSRWLSERGLS